MQKSVTILIDDLTGKELGDGAGETVLFAIDGDSYVIDLDTKSADKLRTLLRTYTSAGRRTSGPVRPRRRRVKVATDPRAVRAWAVANGIAISDRGRIPASVIAQFEAAGN